MDAARPSSHGLVQELVQLQEGKATNGGRPVKIRKTSFPVNGIEVSSWKFNEWDYQKDNVRLPTLARGLFTVHHGGRYDIVTRGYDKFFNVDEVKTTKWSWIEEHTVGPYEMTLKENGCIIFLSAMPDGTLLVCSKHSTGPLQDVVSHAKKGEEWVETHLASVGKSSAQLAATLQELGVTAVAELCDDSFEEHVLKYTPDRAGLYLHGINVNSPNFITYPHDMVKEFANEWGFRTIEAFSRNTIEEVKIDLQLASETGTWQEREIEGFVIRCKAIVDEQTEDFFFKYKFDEPYLMYRYWREVTKQVIGGKEPVVKKYQKVTSEYLKWVRKKFEQHPELKSPYLQNHGIIALRDEFLQFQGTSGMELSGVDEEEAAVDDVKTVENSPKEVESTSKEIVIVPIATVGCGKTTLALALVKLFNWGHIQNDNISGKGTPKVFANSVSSELQKSSVVIADRNNHLRVMRNALFTDVHNHRPSANFVALHYVHYLPTAPDLRWKIEHLSEERVLARGDNHQSIQATTHGKRYVQKILREFINSFQPLQTRHAPDNHFDHVIELHPLRPTRENLAIVIEQLHKHYPNVIPTIPTDKEMDEAMAFALNYQPSLRKRVAKQPDRGKELERVRPRLGERELSTTSRGSKSAPISVMRNNDQRTSREASGETTELEESSVEEIAPFRRPLQAKLMYYAIQMPDEIGHIMDTVFTWHPDFTKLWNHMKSKGRIQKAFHVTLIHRKQAKSRPQLWESYEMLTSKVSAKVVLNNIVWDGRIVAIEVSLPEGREKGIECVNDIPHITLGTEESSIKPFEANQMLQEWRSNSSKDIRHIDIRDYGFAFEGNVVGLAR